MLARNLSRQTLYGVDLRGQSLRGAIISVDCATFDGLQLDDRQVAELLMLISTSDISPAWREGIEALVTSVVGAGSFARLQAILKLA